MRAQSLGTETSKIASETMSKHVPRRSLIKAVRIGVNFAWIGYASTQSSMQTRQSKTKPLTTVDITTVQTPLPVIQYGVDIARCNWERAVSKRDDRERAHAEQDPRDRYIVIAILIVVVALVLTN